MIELGGINYRAIKTSTVEHDIWTMARVADAGIRAVTIIPGESAEEFASRLTGQLAQSGQMLTLLGCILIPDSKQDLDWTPALAADTAKALAALTDKRDKSAVMAQCASLIAGFFEAGLTYFTTSPSYSGTTDNPDPKSRESKKRSTLGSQIAAH